jgi:hypothetical protein
MRHSVWTPRARPWCTRVPVADVAVVAGSLFSVLALVALLVGALIKVRGPARGLVGAGLGALILARILSLGMVASLGALYRYYGYSSVMLIFSLVTGALTLAGIALLVLAVVRAARPSVPRLPAGQYGPPPGQYGPPGPMANDGRSYGGPAGYPGSYQGGYPGAR